MITQRVTVSDGFVEWAFRTGIAASWGGIIVLWASPVLGFVVMIAIMLAYKYDR